ncbi:MAG: flagellar biosynthesis anti-sigma factor FlgM [Spirochaetaceae bacterium]|jgi:negative regulator of flagellin synthesis FlgM|nr:flagellar biosynthesis anti-sigma factor FlgM [Spirochaetaceae bacterium]
MTIGRVSSVNPIQLNKESGRVGHATKSGKSDSVSISAEAIRKSDALKVAEIAKAAPDVRADLVAKIKAKINDPSYINDLVVRGTADRIMDVLWPDSGDGPIKL